MAFLKLILDWDIEQTAHFFYQGKKKGFLREQKSFSCKRKLCNMALLVRDPRKNRSVQTLRHPRIQVHITTLQRQETLRAEGQRRLNSLHEWQDM